MEWAAYVCQNLICQAPVTTCSAAPMKAFGTLFLTVALASCRIAPPHSTPASLESTPQWFEQQLKDQADKTQGKPTPEWHNMADNFFKFMMDNFTTELTVMGARVALTTYNLPFVPGKLKNFDDFHKRFGKCIVAASQK
jgi:hypothetical protein